MAAAARLLLRGAGAVRAQSRTLPAAGARHRPPCHLMPRGVDAELFHPAKRTPRPARPRPRSGLCRPPVGREERRPARPGAGESWSGWATGASASSSSATAPSEAWLRERLPRAEFTGVLQGRRRSPPPTPTWTCSSFPRTPTPSATSCLRLWPAAFPPSSPPTAARTPSFATARPAALCPTNSLPLPSPESSPTREAHPAMREAARAYALTASWDSVFEGVYAGYKALLPVEECVVRSDLAANSNGATREPYHSPLHL